MNSNEKTLQKSVFRGNILMYYILAKLPEAQDLKELFLTCGRF
jgi:hypothetical protein